MDYEQYISVVEDFPKPGISFKDISPLLHNGEAFHQCIDDMAEIVKDFNPTLIIGPESRGFVFGLPISYKLKIGFAMARKKGKLPGKVNSKTYALEYNTATIEVPFDSIKKGDRVVLVDDLLATGGTLKALTQLVEEAGAEVVGVVTLIELKELEGFRVLEGVPYRSLWRL